MTSIFDDRERAFETKWAHDAEQRLRILARRNRWLAEWAVAEAGVPGDEVESRIRALVKTEFEPEGEAAFLRAVAELLGDDSGRVLDRAAELEARATHEIAGAPDED